MRIKQRSVLQTKLIFKKKQSKMPIQKRSAEAKATTTENPKAEKEAIVDKENNSPPKRRSARLSKTQVSYADADNSVEEPEPEKLPFVTYNGEIKYYTNHNEIAEASDFLMQWVEKQTHLEKIPLSFDVEWPFSFQTGPGKASVIQICAEESCCYVFHLSNLKKLPAALVALMKHPKVCLHGVNIKNDFRKLSRDFPEVNADVLIDNCIDLGVWCNEVCETGGRWSLDRLSAFICKKSVDKNKKVRMSKWHVIPLDENQLMYAAIDVYIGQLIYRELEKRQETKKLNEEDFKNRNGEEAFKAVKALGETFLGPSNAISI